VSKDFFIIRTHNQMKIILVITTLTPTKKTKEHNDYLMKPDDRQRHEDGSPLYEEII
jgi:hypothetical protein